MLSSVILNSLPFKLQLWFRIRLLVFPQRLVLQMLLMEVDKFMLTSAFISKIIIMVPLSERGDFRVASLKLEH